MKDIFLNLVILIIFWKDINVKYPYVYFNENDIESFPINLTKCVVDASILLHDF